MSLTPGVEARFFVAAEAPGQGVGHRVLELPARRRPVAPGQLDPSEADDPEVRERVADREVPRRVPMELVPYSNVVPPLLELAGLANPPDMEGPSPFSRDLAAT